MKKIGILFCLVFLLSSCIPKEYLGNLPHSQNVQELLIDYITEHGNPDSMEDEFLDLHYYPAYTRTYSWTQKMPEFYYSVTLKSYNKKMWYLYGTYEKNKKETVLYTKGKLVSTRIQQSYKESINAND